MPPKALIMIEGHRGNGLLYVRAAQSLGLHPITLSTDPASYGYIAAERLDAIRVDTNNPDALFRECSLLRGKYDIAGITGALDSVYDTVAKLCSHFGLPGPDPSSIEQCRDKFAQRQLLAQAGVPVPRFHLTTDATEVERAATEIGLPVILKPAVGSGSSGVRLCRSADELAEHTTYLLGRTDIWPHSPKILVEEFAQGRHYIAHTMGKEVVAIELAHFHHPPSFVFRQSTFPAPLTDAQHELISDISRNCLRVLGLGWGPANIELRWTKIGPVVIEVNPRLAGSPDPQLIQLTYGIDLVTEHLKLVTGDEWNLSRRLSQTAAARYLVPDGEGTLEWISGDSRAADLPGIIEVKMHVRPNTPIVRSGDYKDEIGHIIATSPSIAETEAILEKAVDLIRWSITPFRNNDE
ncbi:ATP-grasp domain-containing protein [Sinorhizobium medicae]|nr:ATP-grasp domain-containing protein [Sinorhizobium medicae]MDX0901632.1 ATP-grasp domain-containing protein [Sinorhizobium medicae]MDX1177406.1 ATP-grasp domain-containing protein [Sinorhizobium medicae]